MTKKVAIGVEYDGSRYKGWQHQANQITIQHEIEKALSKVADAPIQVHGAGRTDAGVHATAQVFHIESEIARSERAWVFGGNTHLPGDIRLLWAKEVPLDFDARRSAIQRRYHYVLFNHPIRPSLLRKQVSWKYGKLDVLAMHQAAQLWLGEHDFSSFRAAECQSRTPMRRLIELNVERSGDLVIFDILANAFLHHMVRNMVGTLVLVGQGERSVNWAREVLEARDRTQAGATAPPNGLYLVDIAYPEHFDLPHTHPVGPWFVKKSLENELV